MEANLRPIPPPHDEDDEDVHWALSTATALWGRGEREEALRWLRRAAEQASDANADLRALELFKAAAEVAQKISVTEEDPGSATATDSPPAIASAPKTPLSAPPQAFNASPATASAPPPRPGASGAGSHAAPSRPPSAEGGRSERSGQSVPPAAASPAAKRSPSVRAPAGDAPAGPMTSAMVSSRDAGPLPRPVGGLGRAVPLAAGRSPAPARSVAVREATPTQLSPAARAAGAAAGLPARPAAGPQAADRPAAIKARPIASFAGSTHARVSSTTAVTEEVPAVKLPIAGAPAGQEPGNGASGAAPQSATGEQLAADGEAPPDQRETVPTAIAVASVARRQASPLLGASSSQEATERRPRLWPDDEGTTRRPLTAQEQRVLMEHRIEDLDEETPMLGLEQAGDGEPSAAAPEDAPQASEDRADWTEAEPDDEDAGAASADQQGEPTLAGGPSGAMQARPSEGAAVDSAWSDPPYEGEWQAPPPRLPASQIEPLPALRIAVIGISSTGELRLVPMDGRNAPPRGAALGILVPLSPGDGETIARLLQLRS
ncbi:hypothetical protein WMF20_20655 [Sorangium sp. So ce834]|uniref:hypothetical protein n=1 Tax=Sorangium sp. So ce834 TaxID=3133321 RepID=UPI003F6298BD